MMESICDILMRPHILGNESGVLLFNAFDKLFTGEFYADMEGSSIDG